MDAVREGRVGRLAAAQRKVRDLHAPLQYAPFLSNHDMTRAMEQLGRDPGKMRVAAALLLTAPGVPFIYYGEEVGIAGANPKGRSPMQWDASPHAGFSTTRPYRPLDIEAARFNVASQSTNPDSILSAYRQLIRLRNESDALRHGRYVQLGVSTPGDGPSAAEESSVYPFARQTDKEVVVVVINLSDREFTDYAIGGGETFGADFSVRQATDLVTGDAAPVPTFDGSGQLDNYRPADALPPYTWRLIRFRR